jgi:DNA-binding PadR family transcriptional regulator
METTAIKVLKILVRYGPLDPAMIKRISGSTYTYKALKKLEQYGLIECRWWLCKITEKGRIALQLAEQRRTTCRDVLCLSTMSDSAMRNS